MNHEYAREQLSALMDGELNEQERTKLYWHVRECEACQNYMKELMELREALREPEEIAVPAGFAAGVLSRLAEEQKPARRGSMRRWAVWGACAAAVLLVVTSVLRMTGGNSASSSALRSDSAPAEAAQAEIPAAGSPDAGEAFVAASMMAEAGEEEAESPAAPAMTGNAAYVTSETASYEPAVPRTAGTAAEAAKDANDEANPERSAPPLQNGVIPYEGSGSIAAEGPEVRLLGAGAADWLKRNGWQGESGDWYADASALRSLPAGLSLEAPLAAGWEGPVRVETEETIR